MNQPNIALLASGNGSNVQAILQNIEQHHIHANVTCILTNVPNAGVIDVAKAFDVPLFVLNHKAYDTRAKYDAAMVKALKGLKTQWVVMAGWLRLVTASFIEAFEGQVLSIHPSLLPSFKGLHAIDQAFDYGVKITGCTVHWVVEKMDEGGILGQEAVFIDDGDTLASLTAKMHSAEHKLYSRVLAQILNANCQNGTD